MTFIAEDGILFRPRAVKGKQWMIDHPVPPPDQHPLLSWYPAVAEMSRAGDMGYTTGSWEFKNDIHDVKPVAFGNFLTVWKKQAEPEQPAAQWQMPANYRDLAKVSPVVNLKY